MSVHSRHHDIGQKQIDGAGMKLGNLNCVLAAARLQDRVAVLSEHGTRERAKRRFVFNEQNRLGSVLGRGRDVSRATLRYGFGDARQIDFEC